MQSFPPAADLAFFSCVVQPRGGGASEPSSGPTTTGKTLVIYQGYSPGYRGCRTKLGQRFVSPFLVSQSSSHR